MTLLLCVLCVFGTDSDFFIRQILLKHGAYVCYSVTALHSFRQYPWGSSHKILSETYVYFFPLLSPEVFKGASMMRAYRCPKGCHIVAAGERMRVLDASWSGNEKTKS